MLKLFFVTSNSAKVASVARVLAGYGIVVVRLDVDLPELQAETAQEIAVGKARAAYAMVKAPVMVIDSAFHVDVLGGFPGTNVKWATKQIGVRGYLDLLWCYPDAARACTFVDALAYMDSFHAQPLVLTRRERGRVAETERGTLRMAFKSPLATVFIPDGETKTLAEMSDAELEAYRSKPHMEAHLRALAGTLTGTPQSFE
jgi:XTP/dITP diphosphohydrolase